MKREEIIKRLGDYHRDQGIAFLSEKDAVEYFRGLVDIIESLNTEIAPKGDS